MQLKEKEMMEVNNKAFKLEESSNKFVLYRILGNDLYPLHKKGQTLEIQTPC